MKLTLTDAEGTIILVLNLGWYDLDNPTSAAALVAEIRAVVARAGGATEGGAKR